MLIIIAHGILSKSTVFWLLPELYQDEVIRLECFSFDIDCEVMYDLPKEACLTGKYTFRGGTMPTFKFRYHNYLNF